MDEALWAALAARLGDGVPVVLASVVEARGATPRKAGAQMLVDAERCAFSVGGGAMEQRVIEAARAQLGAGVRSGALDIALDGQPDSAGVCGGRMRIALRRWEGPSDLARARALASTLAAGHPAELSGEERGDPALPARLLQPRPRLLILGAGHCGQALAELALHVEFEVWVADARPECLAPDRYRGAICIDATPARLRDAADTARDLYVVLLNRDYPTDVAGLAALAGVDCAFLGMMGSRNRIAQVRRALPEAGRWLENLVAPVGMAIGDETPHEIAIGILAQLIARRSARRAQGEGDSAAGGVMPLSSR